VIVIGTRIADVLKVELFHGGAKRCWNMNAVHDIDAFSIAA
jgi:hypothetical protein